jgi:hypothetical protein
MKLRMNGHGAFVAGPKKMQIPFDGAQGRFSAPLKSSSLPMNKGRKANADPSTHHPQAEKRLGPLSLRMTGSFLL